jgi:hypothetical protein
MYFGAGIPKLQHALKSLRTAADQTEDDWRDALRDDFLREYVEPLLEKANVTLRAMDQLADLFARIQRDCT